MRIYELFEGGWDNPITQSTKITPEVVKKVLIVVQRFTHDFNAYLKQMNLPPVKMGHPLGSSAHYQSDKADKEYGDIDLQMIAGAPAEAKTQSQYQGAWNRIADEFIAKTNPNYVYNTGKPAVGHIIFNIGNNQYTQVDMLWALPENAEWARYRTTPEPGIKGAIYGNLYSTLGEIMDMSIQHAGVQLKVLNDQPVNFQRGRKFDRIITLSKDISNFAHDIAVNLFKIIYPDQSVSNMVIDPDLQGHPGLNPNKPQVKDLVLAIRGLAKTFEANDMYGKFNLKQFSNASDFINRFLQHYEGKAVEAAAATKFDKAETPDAQARAQDAKNKLAQGVVLVKQLFQQ